MDSDAPAPIDQLTELTRQIEQLDQAVRDFSKSLEPADQLAFEAISAWSTQQIHQGLENLKDVIGIYSPAKIHAGSSKEVIYDSGNASA